MANLFDPITIGDLTLKNRIIMAPLTRARAIGAMMMRFLSVMSPMVIGSKRLAMSNFL